MTALAASPAGSIEAAWQQALHAYSPHDLSLSPSEAGPSSFLAVARARKTIRDFILSGDEDEMLQSDVPSFVSDAVRLLTSRRVDVVKGIEEAVLLRAERSAARAVEGLSEGGAVMSVVASMAEEKGQIERMVDGLKVHAGEQNPIANVVSNSLRSELTAQLAHHPRALESIRDTITNLFMRQAHSISSSAEEHAFHFNLQQIAINEHVRLIVDRAARLAVERKVRAVLGQSEHDDDEGEADALPFDIPARPLLLTYISQDLANVTRHWSPQDGDQAWVSRFTFYMDVELTKGRTSQLFDLIADWPDSTPAVGDLKKSISQTSLRLFISQTLSASLRKRLLHPGARTRDILQLYVSLVYAVRHIDPQGIVLSRVAGPIRRYLRARPDIVHVIVSSLLGGGDEDDAGFEQLRSELDAAGAEVGTGPASGAAGRQDTSILGDVTIGEDGGVSQTATVAATARAVAATAAASSAAGESPTDYLDPNWTPRPIDAGPSYRQSRSADVIAMLVSIFDDRATFVKALEVSTARALLKSRGYDVQTEYRNNEVLKRRFGDAALARCDVMLQDVVDSRRTDASVWSVLEQAQHDAGAAATLATAASPPLPPTVKAKLPKDYTRDEPTMRAMKPLITSRHFWPDLEGSEDPPVPPTNSASGPSAGQSSTLGSVGPPPGGLEMILPGTLGRAQQHYNRAFTAVRESRRLRWLSGFGSVQVKVEMKDGRVWSERVDPVKAAVLVAAAGEQEGQGEEEAGLAAATPENPLSRQQLAEQMGLAGDEQGRKLLEGAFAWCVSRQVLVEVEGRPGWYVEAEARK